MKDVFNLELIHGRKTSLFVYSLLKVAIVLSIAWFSLILLPGSTNNESLTPAPVIIQSPKIEEISHSQFENTDFTIQVGGFDADLMKFVNGTKITTNESDTHSYFQYSDKETNEELFPKVSFNTAPKIGSQISPCISFYVADKAVENEDESTITEIAGQPACPVTEDGPENGIQFSVWKFENVEMNEANCQGNLSNCESVCTNTYRGMMVGNNCRTLYAASEVCLRVSVAEDGNATLQGGCYEQGKSYALYKKVLPHKVHSFSGLKFIVRNAGDEQINEPIRGVPTKQNTVAPTTTTSEDSGALTFLRWIFGSGSVILYVAVAALIGLLKFREHRYMLIPVKLQMSELPDISVQYDDRQPTFAN